MLLSSMSTQTQAFNCLVHVMCMQCLHWYRWYDILIQWLSTRTSCVNMYIFFLLMLQGMRLYCSRRSMLALSVEVIIPTKGYLAWKHFLNLFYKGSIGSYWVHLSMAWTTSRKDHGCIDRTNAYLLCRSLHCLVGCIDHRQKSWFCCMQTINAHTSLRNMYYFIRFLQDIESKLAFCK